MSAASSRIRQAQREKSLGYQSIPSTLTTGGPTTFETQGYALNFPLIADSDRHVARLYGMRHPKHDEVFKVRTIFVVDPQKTSPLDYLSANDWPKL